MVVVATRQPSWATVAGVKVEPVDVGDAAGAVDDPLGSRRSLHAVFLENGRRRSHGLLERLTLTPVCTSMPRRAFVAMLDRVGIVAGGKPRRLRDGHLGAGARINVAELEGDDAAADEDTSRGCSRSLSTSSEVIISSAPGKASGRGPSRWR